MQKINGRGTRDISQLAEYLYSIYEALGWIPRNSHIRYDGAQRRPLEQWGFPPGPLTTQPKYLFSWRDPLLSKEEKLKRPLSDSGRKGVADDLAGVILGGGERKVCVRMGWDAVEKQVKD